MNRLLALALFVFIFVFLPANALALDSLDALLPTPYLLRSRADDLNIDAATQARIEQMYQAAEPKYHELKRKLEQFTEQLNAALVEDEYDTAKIQQRMKATLEAENELKLYQVRVRISLLSQVTADQRQGARNFASERLEESRWRGDVLSDGELDTLLPRPFWFRSRAEELRIDASTRERLEQTYQSLEPRYHELKDQLDPPTKGLLKVILADHLDEEAILRRFTALLEAETQLKLHQVRVRTTLLSHVSAQKRRAARELAKRKPESDWRKVLRDKVERIRRLSQQLSDNGESVADIEQQLSNIEETISEGQITEGGRRLEQLFRELEQRLESDQPEPVEPDLAERELPPPTLANVSYGKHRRNILDFWQAESDEPTPLAVYYHGGGFRVFDKGKITTKWPATVNALLDGKISVAAVNYRLIQHAPLPAAFHDSRRALQFLRNKATDWNIDASRVAAWGGSAGAQISMYLAFHDDMADPASSDPVERRSTRLTCVATRDGQTSRDYQWWVDHIPGYKEPHMDFHEMFGVTTREAFLRKMVDVSALSLVSRDDPPVYMNYEMTPTAPVPESTPSNPRATISFQGHHVVFGVKLKEQMDKLGVEAHLDYPGSESAYRSVEQFLIAKLTHKDPQLRPKREVTANSH